MSWDLHAMVINEGKCLSQEFQGNPDNYVMADGDLVEFRFNV
jgi:hypothetical protein